MKITPKVTRITNLTAKLHEQHQHTNYAQCYISPQHIQKYCSTSKPYASIITITLSRLPSVRVYARLLLQA
jgi:hypothetical protein